MPGIAEEPSKPFTCSMTEPHLSMGVLLGPRVCGGLRPAAPTLQPPLGCCSVGSTGVFCPGAVWGHDQSSTVARNRNQLKPPSRTRALKPGRSQGHHTRNQGLSSEDAPGSSPALGNPAETALILVAGALQQGRPSCL